MNSFKGANHQAPPSRSPDGGVRAGGARAARATRTTAQQVCQRAQNPGSGPAATRGPARACRGLRRDRGSCGHVGPWCGKARAAQHRTRHQKKPGRASGRVGWLCTPMAACARPGRSRVSKNPNLLRGFMLPSEVLLLSCCAASGRLNSASTTSLYARGGVVAPRPLSWRCAWVGLPCGPTHPVACEYHGICCP